MKTFNKIYFVIAFLLIGLTAHAQNAAEDSKKLVAEGVTLHDEKRYAEAIAKYSEAIKLDPNNTNAYYETGYTLYSSGKTKDAIPYIEKVLLLNPHAGGAYDMLGNIYDDDHQPDKAIETYRKGIDADPDYPRLPFNLSIAYYRTGKFSDAETYAIAAVKHDPKHASSMRAYAMAAYKEQKRMCSLLAWCSFIITEPQTARSAEAYQYIKAILNYGITRKDEKNVNLNISTADMSAGNMIMQLSVINATEHKKDLSSADSLCLQLQSVLKISNAFSSEKQTSFYTNYLAKFFSKLANSNNMPAFTRLISIAAKKDESQAWFKERPTALDELDTWIRLNALDRSF